MMLIVLTSCGLVTNEKTAPISIVGASRPVSIALSEDVQTIQSYSADVSVYTENDRIAGSQTLSQSYRLSVKEIDEEVYYRMDFSAENGPPDFRTILISEDEMVFLDGGGLEVSRMTLDTASDDMILPFNRTRIYFGSFDVDSILTEARRLSLDITEDDEIDAFAISLRPELFDSRRGITVQRMEIYFDMVEEEYLGSEMVSVDDEGTVVTESENYVYEEVDGLPIVIGSIVETHYDYSFTYETDESSIPGIVDPETLPEISEEEAEELSVWEFTPIIGDPADPDYTRIETTLYDNIEINEVYDEVFRTILD